MRKLLMSLLLALLATPGIPAQSDADASPGDRPPRDSEIVEETGSSLLQLDVTVDGPEELIKGLTSGDFILSIAGRPIHEFTVDRFCADPAAARRAAAATQDPEASTPNAEIPVAKPSYVFFFEQGLTTMRGRQQGYHVASDMIDALIGDGARVSIVSSGKRFKKFGEFTDDPIKARQALEAMMDDHRHWDPYLAEERARQGRVKSTPCPMKLSLASMYAREEQARVERGAFRLAATIESLTSVDPPKAVFVFSDALREKAGWHYLSVAESACGLPVDTVYSEFAFERLVAAAAARSTRLYPVYAQGLTVQFNDPDDPGISTLLTSPQNTVAQTEDTLISMALETGGQAFVGGFKTDYAIEQVQKDLGCMYLLSLDPRGLPLDRPLPVTLNSALPGVDVRTRGQVVVQSRKARREAELTAEFLAAPDLNDSALGLSVVPIESTKRGIQHLVQVVAPERGRSGVWDFGITISSDNEIVHQVSGRLEKVPSRRPIVIETLVDLGPGEYDFTVLLTGVDTREHLSAKYREAIELDPRDALILPKIVAQQSIRGVFWRDGEVRNSGSLFYDQLVKLNSTQPVTLTALVCRPLKDKDGPVLRADRTLRGFSMEKAPRSVEVDLTRDHCVAFRDMVPNSWMSEGPFEMSLSLHDATGEQVLSRSKTFMIEDRRPSAP
ncbi:hypothetical protein ABI59_06930 [Acidobacteria bacterium Mor1]|nr:hypothetical protein ABI59_06930 [Acidobacteria bacterium Mor1]